MTNNKKMILNYVCQSVSTWGMLSFKHFKHRYRGCLHWNDKHLRKMRIRKSVGIYCALSHFSISFCTTKAKSTFSKTCSALSKVASEICSDSSGETVCATASTNKLFFPCPG